MKGMFITTFISNAPQPQTIDRFNKRTVLPFVKSLAYRCLSAPERPRNQIINFRVYCLVLIYLNVGVRSIIVEACSLSQNLR